ncbi:hypothetical protein BBU94A_AD24 (plasmid) [Borreliella burgdorferi 94a]|nr:hypothetical protein BBU94A_AD24 [Borreliella burgdorferi 94a]
MSWLAAQQLKSKKTQIQKIILFFIKIFSPIGIINCALIIENT